MTIMFVYVTASSREEALGIGRKIVGERLAACANVLDAMSSIYWWQDRLMEEGEASLILKTTDAQLPQLIQRVRELHSYDCPCVVAFPIADGNPDYLAWIKTETRGTQN
jgi:periplasmic divalent cation tolerance protein